MKYSHFEFWQETLKKVQQWRRMHPEHGPLLFRIQKNLQKMSLESAKHLNNYELWHKPSDIAKADSLVEEGKETIRKLEKLQIIAFLSKNK